MDLAPFLAEKFLPRSCRSESGWDIGLLEILPLEEKRFAGDLGERIGEAIAEIQPGRVAALAEVEEGLARQMRLLNGERFDDDVGSAEKSITLTAGVRPNLAFNDDGEFNKVCGAHQAAVGVVDKLGVEGDFGFPKKMAASAEVSRIIWEDRARHKGIRRDRDKDV